MLGSCLACKGCRLLGQEIGELIAETEYAALGLFLEPNGAQLSVLGD